MSASSYPAGRAIAPKLVAHFAAHLTAESARGRANLAFAPSPEVVEALIGAAFWASLRREEGYSPEISLAYLAPHQADNPLLLEKPLPLDGESLARLSPAVERPGIHLGVWPADGELAVWGATRTLPSVCLVIEVIAPGLLVVKQSGTGDSGKFVNVAVLEGDQVKQLSNDGVVLPGSPPFVRSLLGLDPSSTALDSPAVLVYLAASMRKHGRGGSLLIVPPETNVWRESIVSPLSYSVSPLYSELRDMMRQDGHGRRSHSFQEALRRVIDMVAGLTAVDGATVLTGQCELLAFGVKIARREGRGRIEQVLESEPVQGASARVVHPAQLGGTRHLSAAQFAQDQRDATALVASQDGRFTVFAWSHSQEIVHAYRVEALLL
jgi:hypothetical protein